MQALYEHYGPSLRRKAERLLRSQAEAEDLVQALFVDLWERDAGGLDFPYLYRAVTNRCLNQLRDNKNRARLMAINVTVRDSQEQSMSSEAKLISANLIGRLVNTLDAKRSEVFVYHYLDDMSQDEIAELCSLSRKTVGKYLSDVRTTLSELEAAP